VAVPRWAAVGCLALALGAGAGPAPAGPIDEKVIPLERYSTAKGRALAAAHQVRLLRYSEYVYGCLPWVDVQKQSIGFQRPKFAEGDDRYFSTWIIIDQKEDAEFAAAPQSRRMSAMFSRFGMDLMRRMAGIHDVVADANVHGFSVVVSWLKPGTLRPGGQPVNESVAVFVDKATALDYLEGRLSAAALSRRVRPLAFDGQQDLGPIPLEIWDDPFMATFKLPNYEPPAGITC
jgi:hypothetical protein